MLNCYRFVNHLNHYISFNDVWQIIFASLGMIHHEMQEEFAAQDLFGFHFGDLLDFVPTK